MPNIDCLRPGEIPNPTDGRSNRQQKADTPSDKNAWIVSYVDKINHSMFRVTSKKLRTEM
jgi:hypothetical protein